MVKNVEMSNLKSALKDKGIKVNELCESLGIAKSTYYRKLYGETDFTLPEMKKILELLNVKSPMGIFF